jgi:hypothetical protein
MPETEVLPAKPMTTEKAVRAILRRHARKLTRVLLTPECHGMIEQQILLLVHMLEFLRHEASLKERSEEYTQFCEGMLSAAATSEIGPLGSLGGAGFDAFEKLLDTIVAGMADQAPSFEKLDPAAFISFQKKLLVAPKKRGPKYQPNYDEAFLRHMKGEPISSIARDLEPEAFLEDSANTIQRYFNAMERRREDLARQSSHST